MAKWIVTEEFWSWVEPLLPKHTPSSKGGQPPKSDRLCFTGTAANRHDVTQLLPLVDAVPPVRG